jgi:hypothetical protein
MRLTPRPRVGSDPTPSDAGDEPVFVVMIDELPTLTGWTLDRTAKG